MKLTNLINEVNYQNYKRDKSKSSKSKLNIAIKECNRALFEIERYLKQNKRLREEEGLGLTEYWKETAHKLLKMNERIKSIQKEIRGFGLKDILANIKEAETSVQISNENSTNQLWLPIERGLVKSKGIVVQFIKYNSDKKTFTGKIIKSPNSADIGKTKNDLDLRRFGAGEDRNNK